MTIIEFVLTKSQLFSKPRWFNLDYETSFMKAKFATSCVECKSEIKPGNEISKNPNGSWVHKHCVDEEELEWSYN